MKKLMLSLLLVCSSGYAEEWLEAPNDAGGKILLLTTKCDHKYDGKMVISTSPRGNNSNGCWWFFADMIHVVWASGGTSSYSPDAFVARKRN